jgi:hypothetical protein
VGREGGHRMTVLFAGPRLPCGARGYAFGIVTGSAFAWPTYHRQPDEVVLDCSSDRVRGDPGDTPQGPIPKAPLVVIDGPDAWIALRKVAEGGFAGRVRGVEVTIDRIDPGRSGVGCGNDLHCGTTGSR